MLCLIGFIRNNAIKKKSKNIIQKVIVENIITTKACREANSIKEQTKRLILWKKSMNTYAETHTTD